MCKSGKPTLNFSHRYWLKRFILNKNVLDQFSSEVHQTVQPNKTKLLSVTGEITPFLGKAVLNIEIGSQTLIQKFLFADIENKGILGMDFLTIHQCDLILTHNCMKIKREKIRCFANSRNAQLTCCRVAVSENFTIPPETEMLVEGFTTNVTDRHSTGLIEVDTKFLNKKGLLVAKALVFPSNGTFPIRIANP